jgi:hypothetical protein
MPGRSLASSNRIAVPLSVGIVGLALIGIGQAVPNRHSIENDLTTKSTKALHDADLVGLTVSFSGRDATISGAGQAEVAQRAEGVVKDVKGVRAAKAELAGGGGAAAAAPAPSQTPTPVETPTPAATTTPIADLPLGFTLVDGGIKVTGTVRAKATEEALITAVQATGHGWKVTDKLAVDPTLAAEPLAAERFPGLTQLLATAPIDGTKLVIQYNGETVILRGTPATPEAERALLTAAAGTVPAPSGVLDGLDVPKKS